jgi:hypothetical protein
MGTAEDCALIVGAARQNAIRVSLRQNRNWIEEKLHIYDTPLWAEIVGPLTD